MPILHAIIPFHGRYRPVLSSRRRPTASAATTAADDTAAAPAVTGIAATTATGVFAVSIAASSALSHDSPSPSLANPRSQSARRLPAILSVQTRSPPYSSAPCTVLYRHPCFGAALDEALHLGEVHLPWQVAAAGGSISLSW